MVTYKYLHIYNIVRIYNIGVFLLHCKGCDNMAKKVFIDAGHGGSDSGAVGVKNSKEKDITLSVAKKVEELLKKQGIDVRLSRDTDKYISLSERSKMANEWGADCFVSIHCNAFNNIAKGLEVFSLNSNTSDLAKYVLEGILNENAYTLNRGVKFANFYVLKNTKMRACLVETGFIDNTDDYKILIEKQDEISLGIAKGICKYLKIDYKPTTTTPDVNPPIVDSSTFYRVVCGSFNNKIFAEERLEELKALGFSDAFITAYKKED